MAENMIKFLRGNVASLPQTATAGAVYFTKDEGLYLGLEDGSYHRYGDFIIVAKVADLPTTGAHETCMYYCELENILAKWDKEAGKWTQINQQKTLEQLGGVAKSVYEAKMAALEKADSDNATAISGVDTRLKAAEDKLKSVATTEGLGELTTRVDNAEKDIDALEAAIGAEGSVTKAIADAKKAGTDAQAAAETAQSTADSKVTMGEVEAKNYATKEEAQGYADAKNDAIATAKKAGDDAQADVNALSDKVGTVEDGKTVVGMIGDAQSAADKAQGEVDALETYVGTFTHATAKSVVEYVDAKTTGIATEGDITALDGRVTAVEGAVDAIEADYLKTADKEELQSEIDRLDSKKQDVITENAMTTGDKTVVLNTSDPDYEDHTGEYKISDDVISVEDITSVTAKVRFTVIEGDMDNPENDQYVTNRMDLTLNQFDVVGNKLEYEYPASVEGATAYIAVRSDGIYIPNVDGDACAVFDNLTITYKSTVEGMVVKKEHLPSDVVYQTALDVEIDRATKAEANLQTQINTIMNNPDAEGAINSINEFTQYVTEHGTIADGFRTDIDKNKNDIAANAKAIADQATADAAKYETKEDASAKLDDAKEYADGLNTAMAARVKTLEDIDHDAYVAADEAVLASAKEHANGLNTAMNTRVAALEAIDHDAYKAYADQAEADALAAAKSYTDELANGQVKTNTEAIATKAAQADLEAHTGNNTVHITADERTAWNAAEGNAKAYADGLKTTIDAAYAAADATTLQSAKDYADQAESDAVATAKGYTDALANGAVATNTAVIATKANSADVYAKTETYTKAEVEAMLTWGTFGA